LALVFCVVGALDGLCVAEIKDDTNYITYSSYMILVSYKIPTSLLAMLLKMKK